MSALDASLLRRALDPAASAVLDDLEIFTSIASTNTHLLAKPAPAAGKAHVALADHQTSGRGRHARRWHSAPGAGLCLSLAWTFARHPPGLPALTLAIGVGLREALGEFGIGEIGLKWPNDIVARDRKLGGVLTEVQSRKAPGVTVVAGIGINVHGAEDTRAAFDSTWAQQPVALEELVDPVPARERLAAAVIGRLAVTFEHFGEEGFSPFAPAWRDADWLRGRKIRVDRPEGTVTGTAAGVDDAGALRIDTGAEEVRVISGSIALARGD